MSSACRAIVGLCLAAGTLSPAWAADQGALQRVADRLRVAAAPWCDRLAAFDADGVRRCKVPIKSIKAGGNANAFASLSLHGITEALLVKVDEDELAHVIGHELAHSVLGHAVVRVRRSPGAQHLLPLLDGLPQPHDDVPEDPLDLEFDADALGLYLAGLAGYRVHAQSGLWRRAPTILQDSEGGVATHPPSAQRGLAADALAKRFCQTLTAGALLQPDMPRLQVRYENREDEVRQQQAKLDANKVCAP